MFAVGNKTITVLCEAVTAQTMCVGIAFAMRKHSSDFFSLSLGRPFSANNISNQYDRNHIIWFSSQHIVSVCDVCVLWAVDCVQHSTCTDFNTRLNDFSLNKYMYLYAQVLICIRIQHVNNILGTNDARRTTFHVDFCRLAIYNTTLYVCEDPKREIRSLIIRCVSCVCVCMCRM